MDATVQLTIRRTPTPGSEPRDDGGPAGGARRSKPILPKARPVGGLRMVEHGEADDKIIAVLAGDPTYGDFTDVTALPKAVIDRLRRYFLTRKAIPGDADARISVDPVYGAEAARGILAALRRDYDEYPSWTTR